MCIHNLLFPLLFLTVLGLSSSTASLNNLRSARWRRQRGAARISGVRAAVYHNDCLQELWFEQPIDHFHFTKNRHFKQRYFSCNKYFTAGGPIFFYTGNEADVTMYVNATGLMWENAQEFGALLVFAEHRYYGMSEPFGKDSWKVDPSFLTTEQAMADFAGLVWGIKSKLGISDSPVIAFGGSYGGMLAAWMRMKYPLLIQGAIAASAPIGAFPGSSVFKPSKFWEIVTRDATPDAGADPFCSENVRSAFKALQKLSISSDGRSELTTLLRLCSPLINETDAMTAAYWLQGAFDAFAMGNYPYESSYISGDLKYPLPAWPMRAACSKMQPHGSADPAELLNGLLNAAALLYNASGEVECFNLQATGPAAGNTGPWDYQFCTELDGQEQPYYPTNGITDMFWNQGPFDLDEINQHCQETWKVEPRVHHAFIQFGGVEAASTSSNIVFSNGLMDPWSVFGVMHNVSQSVIAVIIPNGAHHVDLMFSNPLDTPDIVSARMTELRAIHSWIAEYRIQIGRNRRNGVARD